MEWGFRAEPKTGSFPAEGWLFIIGTLALSERNGGSFRADYALPLALCFCDIQYACGRPIPAVSIESLNCRKPAEAFA
jgi:hypothetical protein